jgi:broad specificity phosphatase PhoE
VTRLVLVRHGQSAWNRDGRWQGWADPPLSDLGEQQARTAGARLHTTGACAPAGRLVASDLRRARRTAELIGESTGGVVVVDPRLREYDAGSWTGLRRDEIAARWPEQLAAWDAGELDRTPGGEDPGPFLRRLLDALRRHAAAAGGPVVVVSHGRAIHAVATALGGRGGHIDHLQGWELRLDTGGALELVGPVALLDPPERAAGPEPPGPNRDFIDSDRRCLPASRYLPKREGRGRAQPPPPQDGAGS